jgi:hypothetical protein
MSEIRRLAEVGPTDEEMLKLRNNLSNDAVRGRQSSLYRAQRLAEYALYDGDPELFNSELGIYLSVSADEIREATAKYLDTDNKAILDIIPAAEEGGEPAPADAEQPGEPTQPGAPPPQIPASLESQTDAVPANDASLSPSGKIELPIVDVPGETLQ